MSLGAAYVAIRADTKPLAKGLKTGFRMVSKTIGKMGGVIKAIGRNLFSVKGIAVVALAGWGLKRLIEGFIGLANEQEKVEKRLEAIVKATGAAAGFTIDQLKKMAIGFQQVSVFGDEAVLSAMGILATFKMIKGDAFEKTMQSALDLSTVMGQDLRSSVVMLGKALNDPIANLGALGRAGIQFTTEQRDLIKTLWGAGKAAESQAIILKELQSQFGGAAASEIETFGGKVSQLGNIWGDLKEEIGFVITKHDVIVEWVGKLSAKIKSFIPLVAKNLIPKFDEIANKLDVWTIRNKDLIKSGVAKWLGKVWEEAKTVHKWVKEIIESGDLSAWAKDAVKALGTVFAVVNKTAKAFKFFGEAIGFTAAAALDSNVRDIVFEAKLKGSPVMPFTEGVDYIKNKMSSVSDFVSSLSPTFTIDSNASEVFNTQLERTAKAIAYNASVQRETGYHSAPGKELASNRLAGEVAALEFVKSQTGMGQTNNVNIQYLVGGVEQLQRELDELQTRWN